MFGIFLSSLEEKGNKKTEWQCGLKCEKNFEESKMKLKRVFLYYKVAVIGQDFEKNRKSNELY